MAKKVVGSDKNEEPIHGADVKTGQTIVEGDLVGLNASGQITLAFSATGLGTTGILARGVVLTGNTVGQFGGTHALSKMSYHRHAKVNGFTSLTPGETVFVSTSAAGGVQQGEPSGTGKFRQAVGYAVSATEVMFDVSPVFTTL